MMTWNHSFGFDQTMAYRSDREHTLRVECTITPPEPATWSEWDGGSPGCPACCEDMRVFVVRGLREREIEPPSSPTPERKKWWWDTLYKNLEDMVFERLAEDYDE